MPPVKINFVSNQYWKISKVSSQIFNLNLIRKLTKTYTKKSRQDRRQPRMLQASLENNILVFFLLFFFLVSFMPSGNLKTQKLSFVFFFKTLIVSQGVKCGVAVSKTELADKHSFSAGTVYVHLTPMPF